MIARPSMQNYVRSIKNFGVQKLGQRLAGGETMPLLLDRMGGVSSTDYPVETKDMVAFNLLQAGGTEKATMKPFYERACKDTGVVSLTNSADRIEQALAAYINLVECLRYNASKDTWTVTWVEGP